MVIDELVGMGGHFQTECTALVYADSEGGFLRIEDGNVAVVDARLNAKNLETMMTFWLVVGKMVVCC